VEGSQQAEGWQEMFALIQHPELFEMMENAKDMASACGSPMILFFYRIPPHPF
jgi:hypothetical protein